MANLKTSLRRKNASGTYDTILIQSESTIVDRPSGRTVEQDLNAFLPSVQNSTINPTNITFGKTIIGSQGGDDATKVWVGSSTGEAVELMIKPEGGIPAADISFDDSLIGIGATNLQEAITSIGGPPSGYGRLIIQTLDPSGDPIQNSVIQYNNMILLTKSNGIYSIDIIAGSYTYIVTSPADYGAEDISDTVVITDGSIITKTYQFTRLIDVNKLSVSSSRPIALSQHVSNFDVFGVGGGGGGASIAGDVNASKDDYDAGATGGAGGYAITVKNIQNINTYYSCVIGSGGSGGSFNDGRVTAPTAGGKTIIIDGNNTSVLTANGGGAGVSGVHQFVQNSDYYGKGVTLNYIAGGTVASGMTIKYNRTCTANFSPSYTRSTQYEFGESGNTRYGAAGAGSMYGRSVYNLTGSYINIQTPQDGGGTARSGDRLSTNNSSDKSTTYSAGNGMVNTGGGGGGFTAYYGSDDDYSLTGYGGTGGSGIVIFRWRDVS